MDDATYARRLREILTDPAPTGIDPDDPYGQADDGIDRWNGFGRDVRVTTVRVVAGDHGSQAEVGWVLEVPDDPLWVGLDPEGVVLVPLDARWRSLSGWDDPADYAPVVARAVEGAALGRAQGHRYPSPPRQVGDLPSREEQWRVLLDGLAVEGPVREVAPGRLELSLPGIDTGDRGERVVTVVVTPEEWERVLLHRRVDRAPDDYFADLLGPLDGSSRFIVVWQDDLCASTREELPPLRAVAPRLPPGGRWVAYRELPGRT